MTLPLPAKPIESMSDDELAAHYAALRKFHANLKEQKAASAASLDGARKALGELQAEAKEAFGTADPKELSAKLAEIRAQRVEIVTSVAASIEAVQAKLAEAAA